MAKLTKRVIDKIKPDASGRDVFVWDKGDGALKGFGVRMKPSGVASYLVQYRNHAGQTRRLVIGRVGTLTPDEARGRAADKLSEVAKGGDPSADRHAARRAITVAEFCDKYLADAEAGRILGRRRTPIKPSTLAMDRSRINTHIKPLIGKRTVASLTLRDIEKMQADIAAGKTARARPKQGRTGSTTGGRGVAGRTVGMLATILERARRDGIIERNPARGARRYSDEPRKRFLKIEEITKLGEAMRTAEAEGRSRTGIAAIRALLLTGCRKAEILSLTRDELDSTASCIRFADTKTGAQTRPIGRNAADFLQSRQQAGDWVFPADNGSGHFIGIPRILADLCDRADIQGVSPHVLRHTFGSVAAELGFSEMTISGLLGHSARGVTQRYSHVPDAALLIAADRVSARIDAALDGRTGEVVEMPDLRRAAQ